MKIGYIETHNRKETHELPEGLPVVLHLNLFKVILATNVFMGLLNKMSSSDIDLLILS